MSRLTRINVGDWIALGHTEPPRQIVGLIWEGSERVLVRVAGLRPVFLLNRGNVMVLREIKVSTHDE